MTAWYAGKVFSSFRISRLRRIIPGRWNTTKQSIYTLKIIWNLIYKSSVGSSQADLSLQHRYLTCLPSMIYESINLSNSSYTQIIHIDIFFFFKFTQVAFILKVEDKPPVSIIQFGGSTTLIAPQTSSGKEKLWSWTTWNVWVEDS